jgi:TonB family protein
MHRSSVNYPAEALRKGAQGTVVAQVRTDEAGNVIDAAILSGPDELRKSVLQSVLSWHLTRDAALSTRQIAVSFVKPENPQSDSIALVRTLRSQEFSTVRTFPGIADPLTAITGANAGRRIASITVIGAPDDIRDEILRVIPIHEGDTASPEQLRQTEDALRAFDEHLSYAVRANGSDQAYNLVISANTAGAVSAMIPPLPACSPASSATTAPNPIRVGAAVQAANLVRQVEPVYPPLAKAARVQGIVTLEATIGADGSVKNLRVVSGPPLLLQSAIQAVQQWQYKPTLLNGQPVAVITTIEVNFALTQ